MKGKWAEGIPPRMFTWVIKGQLALSERPGGYARNHRKVRRKEEILWLKRQGFTRVVTLLPSPHNLHAYEEEHLEFSHIPFGLHDEPAVVLPPLYEQLLGWTREGGRLLVHHEEVNDRLIGVVGGYLRWSGLIGDGPRTILAMEKLVGRQLGSEGRELVALAPQLAGAGERVRARVSSAEV